MHEIPHQFSADVLAEAEACGRAPASGRVDLRDIPLVTIDGADARDFDDAVFAEPWDDAEAKTGQKTANCGAGTLSSPLRMSLGTCVPVLNLTGKPVSGVTRSISLIG